MNSRVLGFKHCNVNVNIDAHRTMMSCFNVDKKTWREETTCKT